MDGIRIVRIANTLQNNGLLLKNWVQFKDTLGLFEDPSFDLIKIKYYNSTITAYELFLHIILSWSTQNGSTATVDSLCNTLETLENLSASQAVQAEFSNNASVESSLTLTFFRIGKANPSFVGRTNEFKRLNDYYINDKTPLVKIIGLGGVGKSELAKTYAHLKKTVANGIWLNGESRESLQNSIFELAKLLNIETVDNDKRHRSSLEIFQEIIDHIQLKYKYRLIVVIDNVDIGNNEVEIVTRKARDLGCFILVTSRHVEALGVAGEVLNLYVLGTSDANSLISDIFTEESKEDVEELCHLLQNFPLALQQAISFIKNKKSTCLMGQSYKIRNYLNDFGNKKIQMLNFKLSNIEHEYASTTFVTWNISIDQISAKGETGKLAIELLHLIAYLEADAISVKFIFQLHSRRLCGVDSEIEAALTLLKAFSLIKSENRTISIHRLVQEVTRVFCSESNLEFDILQKYAKSLEINICSFTCSDMTNVLCLWNYATKFSAIVKECRVLPEIIVMLLNGHYGPTAEAEIFAKESCSILNAVLGSEALETLKMKERLAYSMNWNGTKSESLGMYESVLREQISVLGENHKVTIQTRKGMAYLLRESSRYDEAMMQYQTLVEMHLKSSEIDAVMELKLQIANTLKEQHRVKEALLIYKEVSDYWIRDFEDSKEISPDMRCLAAKYNCDRKDFETAKLQLEPCLKLPSSPDTITAKMLLADVFDQLGEKEKEVELLREVLASTIKQQGRRHPDTNRISEKRESMISPSQQSQTSGQSSRKPKSKCALV